MHDLIERLATAVWGEAGDQHSITILETARLTAAGYVIVPSIPTQEMRNAAYAAINRGQKGTVDIYRAMLAAAPKITE